MLRKFKIRGSGTYFPKKIINSTEIDKQFNFKEGTTEKKLGVRKRHYITDETNSIMAKYAILEALKDANMDLSEIDCILATSGTPQQPIPCNASLIQEELGMQGTGVPAFDVNCTCLSFLVGLDLISYPIQFGKYKNVVIVSSEISSIGLNYENFENSALFGDGACAFIISKSDNEEASTILSSKINTYSEGAHMTEIRGGGSALHPKEYQNRGVKDFSFDMDGKGVVKLSMKYGTEFMKGLLEEAGCKMDDISYIVPHQGSTLAMKLIGDKMMWPKEEEKVIKIIGEYGNVISACIPIAWDKLRKSGNMKKGDKIILVGTSAGVSIGGMVIKI